MKTTLRLILIAVCFAAVTSCSTEKFAFRTKLKVSEKELATIKQQRETQLTRVNHESSVNATIDNTQTLVEKQDLSSSSIPYQMENTAMNSAVTPIKVEVESSYASVEETKIIENEVQLKKENPEITPTDKSATKDGEGQTDGMALTSFIVSIAGLFIAGLILGTLGIIFGAIGLGRTSGGKKKGQGLAIAGLIIGILDVLLVLLLLSTL